MYTSLSITALTCGACRKVKDDEVLVAVKKTGKPRRASQSPPANDFVTKASVDLMSTSLSKAISATMSSESLWYAPRR